MKRHSPPPALIKFLKPYDAEVRELALGLRSLVIEEMAPCYENIYDAYSAVAMGYGPTDRLSDGVFHIAVYSHHVNLGFNEGATLDDPQGILVGGGTRIRHISIKTPADLARPEIRSYVRRARKVAIDEARKLGETTAPAPPKAGKVSAKGRQRADDDEISIVKAIYARKRRPGAASKR